MHSFSWMARRAIFAMTGPQILKAVLWRLPILGQLFRDESLDGWRKPHPFDAQYGISTNGYCPARDLCSGKTSDIYITGYSGCHPSIVRQVLQKVPCHDRTAFLDLGCGKGRALIVASEFCFREIIGVELAPSLCTIALSNIEALGHRFPDRTKIKVIEGDAAEFVIPTGRIAIFLNHPFHKTLMKRLLQNLERAVCAEESAVHIIYCNPVWRSVFDESPCFRRLYMEMLHCDQSEKEFAPASVEPVIIWESLLIQTLPPSDRMQRNQ